MKARFAIYSVLCLFMIDKQLVTNTTRGNWGSYTLGAGSWRKTFYYNITAFHYNIALTLFADTDFAFMLNLYKIRDEYVYILY